MVDLSFLSFKFISNNSVGSYIRCDKIAASDIENILKVLSLFIYVQLMNISMCMCWETMEPVNSHQWAYISTQKSSPQRWVVLRCEVFREVVHLPHLSLRFLPQINHDLKWDPNKNWLPSAIRSSRSPGSHSVLFCTTLNKEPTPWHVVLDFDSVELGTQISSLVSVF